jgi:ADP-ribose pyrophosphatase YjhB (NUDIX family)
MLYSDLRYCPRCAAELVQAVRFGRQRPTCPRCEWVYFADPKVAVAGLLLQNRQVLLVQRLNDPFRGSWTLPAGFVDAGEDPRQALARECLEETGLVVEVADLLDVVAGAEHARGADILIVYKIESASGGLCAGDDAGQAAFFALDCLPPLAFASTTKIIDQFAT